MPTTPVLALPYPTSSDTADVPRDIQALAVKLDGISGIAPPLVSALPGSPVDGQEIYYQSAAMATDGIMWHLRYRAGATGSFKWEFVGGAPLFSAVETMQSAGSSGAYIDLATVGPQVTLPLAGDYDVTFGCSIIPAANAGAAIMGIGYGASWTTPAIATAYTIMQVGGGFSGTQISVARAIRLAAAAAAAVLKTRYYAATATPGFGIRYLTATPVRVG